MRSVLVAVCFLFVCAPGCNSGKVAELNNEIESLRSELKESKAQALQDLEEANRRLNEQTQELVEAKKQIETLKLELKALQDSQDQGPSLEDRKQRLNALVESARGLLNDADRESKELTREVAKQQVELDKAKASLAKLKERLDESRTEIEKLREFVANGKGTFQVLGKSFTPEQVGQDLARRLKVFKSLEASIQQNEVQNMKAAEYLESRRKTLQAVTERRKNLITEFRNVQLLKDKVAQGAELTTTQIDELEEKLNQLKSKLQ